MGPVTPRDWLSIKAKPPAPVLAKAPRVVIALPVPAKLAPPLEEPVRVAAVITLPAAWLIAPPVLLIVTM